MDTINPEVTGQHARARGGPKGRSRQGRRGKKGPKREQDSENSRTQMHLRRQSSETMSFPEAGAHYYGLGRNASYEAVKSGLIPTIQVGKKLLRVPRRLMEARMSKPDEKKEAAA